MAIQLGATRQLLAAYYASLGTYFGVATGAPGTTTTPANEATGGSPAYARVATTWTAGAGGAESGSPVTLNVAPATYNNAIFASAATLAAANMLDNCTITSTVISAQGQIVLTPAYAQS